MSLLVKKEPWKRFAPKVILLLGTLWILGNTFAERYRIGFDPQLERCLPEYSVFLIDLKDTNLQRGNIYAFEARGMMPFYEDGTQMVKILTGLPGDTVEVNEKFQVVVNGVIKEQGLHLSERLGLPGSHFIGKTTLPNDQYWFLGKSQFSFDSRYWGSVNNEQVIGRAYPLF